MVMNPHEIEHAEFRTAFRGYDKPEVREFLRRTAEGIDALQAELEAVTAERDYVDESLAGEAGDPDLYEVGVEHEPVAPDEDQQSTEVQADSGYETDHGSVVEGIAELDDSAELNDGAELDAAELNDGADQDDSFDGSVVIEELVGYEVDGADQDGAELDDSVDQSAMLVSNEPDDHRFQALGDRIAGLLRSAHESATHLRDTAENEAVSQLELAKTQGDAIRAEAEVDAEAIRSMALAEADEIRARSEVDADRLMTGIGELQIDAETVAEEAKQTQAQALVDAEGDLKAERDAVEALSNAAQADRDQAMAELTDARGQVAELLGQARSQSDFIRHEADEVIRARVRRNMDQAEERLNVLRNSEIASRERIVAAHRELEGAMARLDLDPSPELPIDAEQYALDGANQRAEASRFGELDASYDELDAAADAADLDQRNAAGRSSVELPRLGNLVPEAEGPSDAGGLIEVEAVDAGAPAPGSGQTPSPAEQSTANEMAAPADPADEGELGLLVRKAMEQAFDSARLVED